MNDKNTRYRCSNILYQVDFSSITKIIFYYDYVNASNDSTVFYKNLNQISANNQFLHDYGLFNTPFSKTYDVKMIVYSSASCLSSLDRTITINANPVLVHLPSIICLRL